MNGTCRTSVGTGQFFLGLIMMCVGFYLLLSGVVVNSTFGLGSALFGAGGHGVTGGMILIPLVIGVGIIFFNGRSWIGWLLALGALAALLLGVIASVNMNLRSMTAFELLCILTLAFGGLGMFVRSLCLLAASERRTQGQLRP